MGSHRQGAHGMPRSSHPAPDVPCRVGSKCRPPLGGVNFPWGISEGTPPCDLTCTLAFQEEGLHFGWLESAGAPSLAPLSSGPLLGRPPMTTHRRPRLGRALWARRGLHSLGCLCIDVCSVRRQGTNKGNETKHDFADQLFSNLGSAMSGQNFEPKLA